MGPYIGDFKVGQTLYFTWDTNNADGASIAPSVAGTISVYKDDSIVQSVAGITDSRAYDGIVGVHNVKVELTDAFYAAGHDYHVVLTACTIDGQVVNATLAEFSIENRNRDISALAVDNIWDEQGAGHAIIGTFGQRLQSIRANLATGGAPGSITLDAGASIINDFYKDSVIMITGGLGISQSRKITGYNGGTLVATIQPDWLTTPNGTSEFVIIPSGISTLGAGVIDAVLDADLQLHLGAGVGGRNIGNILGHLAQSEFEQRINVFATIPIVAQGITANMVVRGCIQYQTVDMSYTKNWAAPDRTYYLLFHYNAQHRNDMIKPSQVPVW